MRNMVFCLLLALSSCQEDADLANAASTYFPQQIGNWWEYEGTRREIVDTLQWQGLSYYVWATTYSSNNDAYVDTAYYRVDQDQRVYVKYDITQAESLLFDFSLDAGETLEADGKKITLTSTKANIKPSNTQISDCFSFYYDIPGLADDEHTIYLAPGIGIVSTVPDYGIPQKLSSAFVGGKMDTF